MLNVKSIAVAQEEMLVRTEYNETERERMQSDFLQQSFQLAKLEEDKKANAESFRLQMEPIQKIHKQNLTALRNGFKEEHRMVYLVPDHESSMMEFYTDDGVLVMSRRLRPDERQTDFLRAVSNQ